MPRKYRPPAARRRKTKRPAPNFIEPVPEDGDLGPAVIEEETVSTLEREEPAVPPPAVATAAERPVGARGSEAGTRHINRDYSYVRAEIRRIGVIAGFLIVSLIITAILRG